MLRANFFIWVFFKRNSSLYESFDDSNIKTQRSHQRFE